MYKLKLFVFNHFNIANQFLQKCYSLLSIEIFVNFLIIIAS